MSDQYHTDADYIEILMQQNKRLREALGKIANTGQSIEPDHWKFRVMAREAASAALCTNKGGDE